MEDCQLNDKEFKTTVLKKTSVRYKKILTVQQAWNFIKDINITP